MSEEQNYKANVSCSNCGFEGNIDIPTGLKISEYFCPNCKCNTLNKKMDVFLG